MTAIEKDALSRVLQPEADDRHEEPLILQDNLLLDQPCQPCEGGR